MTFSFQSGLFRSDQLLGSANASLSDLETKCQIFDSFPLTTGRKAIGGQLQIRVKLREPLLAKQIKEIREKWLVFD
jgi:coiled-coil and C2 domain-containing protein 1